MLTQYTPGFLIRPFVVKDFFDADYPNKLLINTACKDVGADTGEFALHPTLHKARPRLFATAMAAFGAGILMSCWK